MEVARWRTLGIELAFDPARPRGLSERGRAQLAAELANLDAERLIKLYPRDAGGRLALDEMVLLAPIEPAKPVRSPKQQFLAATSPARRGDRQVITLGLHVEIARNFEHRWELARWLWDTREADASDEARWGVTSVPLDLLAPGAADEALRALAKRKKPTTGERAAHAIVLARAGRWREALALYGVTHDLDALPYKQGNHGHGIDKQKWEAARDDKLREVAPWRFPLALERLEAKQTEWRLFTLPGQTTAMKHCVVLRSRDGKPHLGVGYTGSNTRAPDLWWRWPPDLALVARGAAPVALAARPAIGAKHTKERSLLAQIAADPRDLDIRRVYADLLTERELPRGEFITLQLLAADGALDLAGQQRMKQLERIHGRDWLGALGALVHGVEYERGFVVRCTLGGQRTPFDVWQAAVAPEALAELSTVRDLTLAGKFPASVAKRLLAADSLPSLERLALPIGLVEHVRRPLDVLTLDIVWGTEWAVAEALFESGFEIDPIELRFRVDWGYFSQATEVLRRVSQLSPTLRRFVIDANKVTATLSRDADDVLNQLEVLPVGKRRAQLGWYLTGALPGIRIPLRRLVVDARTLGTARDELRFICRAQKIELVVHGG